MGPRIRTDRLILDELVPDDAQALYTYRSHELVARFQSWVPGSVEEALAFIERNAATLLGEDGAWVQLAVRSRATGGLLGDLGMHFVGAAGPQVEIGFTIAPAHQRHGYGSEAVTALLEHLFTARSTHRVYASVDPRNAPSIGLLERVGLRREAHFRESLFWRGEWVDDVVYAILRSEWTAPRERSARPR